MDVTTTGEFEVLGTPTPQGSKTAIMVAGRPRLIEGKAGQRDNIKSWRSAVADTAPDSKGTDQ